MTHQDTHPRTTDDVQAALEHVKREAWQQGYETGTGEIGDD